MINKLLIITQKVDKDDSYFGFFHDWILEFSKHFDLVTVISLEVHNYDLPKNVRVLSLGKEKGISRLKYTFNFYKFLLTENYDTVFVHMSPIYMILGFPFWLLKTKSLWYVHRNVDLKLRVAHFFSNIIFTATKESFGIESKKINYMGQAVDLKKFTLEKRYPEDTKIITVGRITQIKNLDILIRAIDIINKENIIDNTGGATPTVEIIGEPVLRGDIEYKDKLVLLIKDSSLENKVNFTGKVANKEIAKYYSNSTFSINLCPTGGLDKAVLESMATKTLVLLCNKAFLPYIERYKEILYFNEGDVYDCKNKIKKVMSLSQNEKEEIASYLYNQVKERSSLDVLIKSIVSALKNRN